MSSNLEVLVDRIRAVRREKLPQAKDRLEKLMVAKQAIRSTQTNAARVADHSSELQDKLKGIRYDDALKAIEAALKATEQSVARLSRESINIGVAGMARQGKSKILQMLTGLTDRQIPTGDAGFCTAARSVVTNGSVQSATVFFMSEAELMAKKVRPAYEPLGSTEGALGLSPMPSSLSSFLAQPVSPLRDNPLPSEMVYWNGLNALHKTLVEDHSLVDKVGGAPIQVPIDDVRRYVAKDTGVKDSEVVDHVEIITPFDVDLPKGMVVFDLPGLGEMSPNIRATMLKTVSDDTDIVLLMRKPVPSGDDWKKEDFEITDMLKQVYPDGRIKPSDWVQVVLNHDTRQGHDNTNNVDHMLESASADFKPVKCDCGSKDAVRDMINSNMDRLIRMASTIDDYRIDEAEKAYASAMTKVGDLYRKLKEATADIIVEQGGFKFKPHWKVFKDELRYPFKYNPRPDFKSVITPILESHFKQASVTFKALYEKYDSAEEFPEDFPFFSKKRLVHEFGGGRGATEPISASIRNQCEVLKRLLESELSKCCDNLVDVYFKTVVAEGFEQNKAIQMVVSDSLAKGLTAKDKVEKFLSLLRSEGGMPTLESALEGLLSLSFTFDSTVLPMIFAIKVFQDFDPERRVEGKSKIQLTADLQEVQEAVSEAATREEQAEILYSWQEERCLAILSETYSGSHDSPLEKISTYVTNAMHANYIAFVNHFIWGERCEDEWERLLQNNKRLFWNDEIEKAEASSALAREWAEALSQLKAVVA